MLVEFWYVGKAVLENKFRKTNIYMANVNTFICNLRYWYFGLSHVGILTTWCPGKLALSSEKAFESILKFTIFLWQIQILLCHIGLVQTGPTGIRWLGPESGPHFVTSWLTVPLTLPQKLTPVTWPWIWVTTYSHPKSPKVTISEMVLLFLLLSAAFTLSAGAPPETHRQIRWRFNAFKKAQTCKLCLIQSKIPHLCLKW